MADVDTIAIPGFTNQNTIVNFHESRRSNSVQELMIILRQHRLPHPFAVATLPKRSTQDWFYYFFKEAEPSLMVPRAWNSIPAYHLQRIHNHNNQFLFRTYENRFWIRISVLDFFRLYHDKSNSFSAYKLPIEFSKMWQTLTKWANRTSTTIDNASQVDDPIDILNGLDIELPEYDALTRAMTVETWKRLEETVKDEHRPMRTIPSEILQWIPEHMYRMADVPSIALPSLVRCDSDQELLAYLTNDRPDVTFTDVQLGQVTTVMAHELRDLLYTHQLPHAYAIAVLPKRFFQEWRFYFFGIVSPNKEPMFEGQYDNQFITAVEFVRLIHFQISFSDFRRDAPMLSSRLWNQLCKLAFHDYHRLTVGTIRHYYMAALQPPLRQEDEQLNRLLLSPHQLKQLQSSHQRQNVLNLRIPDAILHHIPKDVYRAADVRTIAVSGPAIDPQSEDRIEQISQIMAVKQPVLPHSFVVALLAPRSGWEWYEYFFDGSPCRNALETQTIKNLNMHMTALQFMHMYYYKSDKSWYEWNPIEYTFMWWSLTCMATGQCLSNYFYFPEKPCPASPISINVPEGIIPARGWSDRETQLFAKLEHTLDVNQLNELAQEWNTTL